MVRNETQFQMTREASEKVMVESMPSGPIYEARCVNGNARDPGWRIVNAGSTPAALTKYPSLGIKKPESLSCGRITKPCGGNAPGVQLRCLGTCEFWNG